MPPHFGLGRHQDGQRPRFVAGPTLVTTAVVGPGSPMAKEMARWNEVGLISGDFSKILLADCGQMIHIIFVGFS